MPDNQKTLRRRVRSIKSTRQVTRAMEMVSAAKLRRAQGVLMAGRPYALKLQELLSFLGGSESVAAHPLFASREGKRALMVVFTSDRGLCGAYNSNLIRKVEKTIEADAERQWELICIGRKGYDYFRKRKWPVVQHHIGLGGSPETDFAREVSDDLVRRFVEGETDEVHLAYSSFVSMAVYRPVIRKFLNLDAEGLAAGAEGGEGSGETANLDYILEPTPQRVFEALLSRYLSSKIYITLAEVFTSEHSARMLAMNNATKNCKDLADELTLRMNKARQAAITKELLDIVGGASAIQE